MKFRRFGRQGWKVSALGFGCMRLPTADGAPQSEKVDRETAVRMIRAAVDRGVNYIDTAYPYHNGVSETVVGEALRDGYRDRVRLVTKSPVWLLRRAEDFDTYLDEQLKRLGAARLDFYLLHALNTERWRSILELGVLGRAEAAVKDGRIGGLGFSFHDKLDVFKAIVDGYDGWALCQVQYNYMDTANQAGTEGVRHAASKGLPVVVMEPLLGGRLARPPRAVREVFDGFESERSPADWALQWLWNQPEVAVVLSGMGRMSELEQNLRSAERSSVRSMPAAELRLIERVRETYRKASPIPCTKCGYCLPCPNGVNIPRNFELYNDGFIHDDPGAGRMLYGRFLTEAERASACVQCGACEKLCPQGIPVGEWMPKVHSVLGEGESYP
jgi:predicted aldo/keto reductase-like oxidoreductase